MSGIPSAEVFQAIVDRIDSGVYAVDLDGKISYWNYGAEKISGFLSQEVLGRACRDSILVEYDDHNPVMCVHHCPLEGVRNGSRQEAMTYLRHRAGHVVPVRLWTMALKDRAGNIVGAVKVFSEKIAVPDLREETSQARVEDLDAESGVPSRVSTETFLREQIEACTTQKAVCGIIAIRLENFDDFRHGHGMEAGSAMIREVARTLKDMVRRSDMVGRWTTDGFLGMLPGCGIEPLGRVAAGMKRVASRVAIPWWGDRLSLNVSAKITMIESGDTLEALEERLRAAEEEPEQAATSTGA